MSRALDLLRLEADLLFGLDTAGRVGRGVDLVVIVTPAGEYAVLTGRTGAEFGTGHVTAGGEPPPGLSDLVDGLTAADGIERSVTGGPSYVVPIGMPSADTAGVVTSTDPDAARTATRPASWQAGEWRELLAGGAGSPWAMALQDGAGVSVCHTPRADARAAEAGTWTDPQWRGRGLAAATTAAWSALFATGTTLFYSTAAANRSSQAVAGRLDLRHLGWMWKVAPASFVA